MNNMSLLNSLLLQTSTHRIKTPSDFHGQVQAIKLMMKDDVSGMIDSLTDFSVQSACVDYSIEFKNKKLTKTFAKWLKEINISYNGKIPSGIKALAEEFFKERWKYSSFPVLKILKWDVDADTNLILPSRLCFLDGGSLHAHNKFPGKEGMTVDQFEYSIGKDGKILRSNVIFSRGSGRWFDAYPNPYLIKRGVYSNFQIINSLKRNEMDVLDQIIPYLLQVKKNTERLAIDRKINYDDDKLKEVLKQIEKLVKKSKSQQFDLKQVLNTPVRVTQFDEEIKHLIPDLEAIFKQSLFAVAEKNILSGLGFIDVVDGAATTRRESILNPRPFIKEVDGAVSDFTQLLNDLVYMIKTKNTENKHFKDFIFNVAHTPVRGFMSGKFKEQISSMWDRGLVSSQTATELIAEVPFEIEVMRREKEGKEGTDMVLYPHLTQNREGVGSVDVGENEDTIADPKKKKPLENKDVDKANLHTHGDDNFKNPFPTIRSLPIGVKERIKGISKRRKWLKIFDSVFNFYKGKGFAFDRAEAIAFATAWEKFDTINNMREFSNAK